MYWLILICILLAAGYTVLLLLYRIGWALQCDFEVPDGYQPATRISIVIAARNESKQIEACLSSLLKQDYPATLFDITVVDDFSEDDTANKVRSLNAGNVQLIALKDHVADRSAIRSFKKKALEIAIAHTRGELIITTDADCIADPLWLRTMAAKYEQTQAKMIVAPVDFTSDGRVVEVFQSIDFLTMQGITAAAHRLKLGNMSNGANLAFTRAAYEAVNGYQGIDHLASGDDYLLMVKVQERFPGSIHYLKSGKAIIRTVPQPDWHSFLQQRIRWASKSGKYNDPRLTMILVLVYFFNLSFPVLLVASLFDIKLLNIFFILVTWKILAELLFLWPVAGFFNKRKQLILFPFLQALHIVYITLAGFLGYKGRFVWKGRTVE